MILWIILILITGVAAFIVINLYNKLLKYESYFYMIHHKLLETLKNLNELDHRGMFAEDDEVGILWDNIKEILFDLRNLVVSGKLVTVDPSVVRKNNEQNNERT